MGTSYQQPGEVLEFTAPTGGVTKGGGVLVGNLILIALDTVAQTLQFRGMAVGVHLVDKAASQAWAEGAIVYWDDTAKVFTTVSTANFRAGVAVEAVAAGAGDIIGKVRLNGIGVTAVGGVAP
jgi:predicted RecA/RadA family phage recombinase